jgi:glycosyltransferase involved in cell wall biosynthesis
MKISVLADNLAGGGARLVEDFLASLREHLPDAQIHVFCSNKLKVDPVNVKVEMAKARNFFWAHVQRSRWAHKKSDVDVILNFTNFPTFSFWRSNHAIELCLVHNAFLVAAQPCDITRPSSREKVTYVARALFFKVCFFLAHRRLTVILLQTAWMNKEFRKRFGEKLKTMHVPFALPPSNLIPGQFVLPEVLKGRRYWFYPAGPEYHKNHNVTLHVARKLKEMNANVCLVVTLDPLSARARFLEQAIREGGLQEHLLNMGWLETDSVSKILQASEGLFFPSSIESLGLPFIEALLKKKKIVAQRSGVAEELADSTVFLFDFSSEAEMDAAITILTRNPELSDEVTVPTLKVVASIESYLLYPLRHLGFDAGKVINKST